ncbi:MAG: hypothetical protein AAGG46_04820 [Planctomycetota bacterium]
MPEPGHQLDLRSGPATSPPGDGAGRGGRFLGVVFDCCGVYSRIYPNRSGDAYEGRCPRCGGPVRVAIGPGGTSTRFFTAS